MNYKDWHNKEKHRIIEFQIYNNGLNCIVSFETGIDFDEKKRFDGIWLDVSLFNLIGFSINYNKRADHAGYYSYFTLFGKEFHFNVIDDRHWDYEHDDWERWFPECKDCNWTNKNGCCIRDPFPSPKTPVENCFKSKNKE